MDRELFQSWFKDLFLASTSREKTQLILMDNHSSHISVEILELARKSNVVFIALPSKTTHILQPLDKTVFSAMGAHHQSTSAAARLLKPSHSLALSDFLPIFADTFTKSVTPANIMASFKVTGVYPTDRRVIPQHVLAPSEVHRAESGMEPLSPEEEALFQRRVSEGYDVPDARYDMWKAARAAPTQDTGFVEMPLATSLVTAGVISPSTASIFMTPAVTPRRLPSAASQARTLTSDEFFTALQRVEEERQKKEDAKEANRRQREQRRSSTSSAHTSSSAAEAEAAAAVTVATAALAAQPTPTYPQTCLICGEACNDNCADCFASLHTACLEAVHPDGKCVNCVPDTL
ncbi:uncharacterized protein LOC135828375 [Sycon ciliatum]|uniref:uncharacterized protein LOC135828375 n=1 Tax=Sycon ciliatum TaxID=27933 RepID=UPI0031F698C0